MPTYHRRMGGATQISADLTAVDCHRQVRSWRLLRALVELLIPTCNCTFMQETNHMNNNSRNESRFSTVKNTTNKPRNSQQLNPNPRNSHSSSSSSTTTSSSSSSSASSLITGTIFGYRKGKVKFCIQTTSSTNPVLLLELAVSTTVLAHEMRSGLLRIALECSTASTTTSGVGSASSDLLEMPVWRMYCNGRRVGYALRRRPSKADVEVLSRMRSVVVGAGVIEGREFGCEEDDIMYLRGNFERVCGSSDAESFHLIDPDGSINQDLSIFFLRSP